MKHLPGAESVGRRDDGPRDGIRLTTGQVTAVAAGAVTVETGHGRQPATRAVSCLVAPEPGDRVLLTDDGDAAHVLAVLERPGDGACTLSPAGARALDIAAPRVGIVGDEAVSVRGRAVRLDAETATLRVAVTRYVGRMINCFARALEVTADRLQSVSRSSVHQAQTYARSVDGVDTVRAGDALRQCARTATWQSKQTIIVATGDVRIDGERIGLG